MAGLPGVACRREGRGSPTAFLGSRPAGLGDSGPQAFGPSGARHGGDDR